MRQCRRQRAPGVRASSSAREQLVRERLGGVGGFLARVIGEPSSTKVWKQGAEREERTAIRLEKHLVGTGVLLHDRRIPGHSNANIDHLAIGPGGVTVIDSKTHRGKVAVDRVGGLFAPRKTVLSINGHDRTSLVDGVERLIGFVRWALSRTEYEALDIRGALSLPNVDVLPLFYQLAVRDVVIDGPKPIAKLAGRVGQLSPDVVHRQCEHLDRRFPAAYTGQRQLRRRRTAPLSPKRSQGRRRTRDGSDRQSGRPSAPGCSSAHGNAAPVDHA
jgi:Nuclease-related domain